MLIFMEYSTYFMKFLQSTIKILKIIPNTLNASRTFKDLKI